MAEIRMEKDEAIKVQLTERSLDNAKDGKHISLSKETSQLIDRLLLAQLSCLLSIPQLGDTSVDVWRYGYRRTGVDLMAKLSFNSSQHRGFAANP